MFEILNILLWITVIILMVGGIDDLLMDFMFFFNKRNYKKKLVSVRKYDDINEKPIALMIGAWNENKVIKRTVNFILNNIKYSNYKIFIGVYPNDMNTISEVYDLMKISDKVILSVNAANGPTTKADNLNNIYSNIKSYEKKYEEFSIISVFDAEDFIHPYTLKLQNYYINKVGYDSVQIPVIPIRSKLSGFIHKTYCDMFAELHQKDMIIKQQIDSYVPFAGTGMCFKRSILYELEINGKNLEPISTYRLSDTDTIQIEKINRKPKLIYWAIILIIAVSLLIGNVQLSNISSTQKNNIEQIDTLKGK